MFTFLGRLLSLGMWKPQEKVGPIAEFLTSIQIQMFEKNEKKILALCERYFEEDPNWILSRLKNRGTTLGFLSEDQAEAFFKELEPLLSCKIEMMVEADGSKFVNTEFGRHPRPNWWFEDDISYCDDCDRWSRSFLEGCDFCGKEVRPFSSLSTKEVKKYEQKLKSAA